MSDSIVCIPTFRRPEFLALTLERISKARDVPDDIRIFLDTSDNERLEEVHFVRDNYLPVADIFHANKHISVLSGCWNILESLKACWETGKKYIFFIEEDVFITHNFFQRHLELHNLDNYFVTCGRRHGNMPIDFYSNPGTCYTNKSFSHVISHINDRYFSSPEVYLNKHFPSQKGMDGVLDDGLIRKVCRSVNGKVRCHVPKICAHIGFRYYQKFQQYRNEGTIEQRISWARNFLSDIPERKRIDPKYIQDLEEL